MFEYDAESCKAVELLDRLDLTEILTRCIDNRIIDLWDIRDELMKDSVEIEKAVEDLTFDELMEYLSKRYNLHFNEEITYHVVGVPRRSNLGDGL